MRAKGKCSIGSRFLPEDSRSKVQKQLSGAEEDLGFDSLDIVGSLVDKNLLSQHEQADGEPRFRMLAVIREFAFEKLAESGEVNEIKRRHAAFYTALSEEAEPELKVR